MLLQLVDSNHKVRMIYSMKMLCKHMDDYGENCTTEFLDLMNTDFSLWYDGLSPIQRSCHLFIGTAPEKAKDVAKLLIELYCGDTVAAQASIWIELDQKIDAISMEDRAFADELRDAIQRHRKMELEEIYKAIKLQQIDTTEQWEEFLCQDANYNICEYVFLQGKSGLVYSIPSDVNRAPRTIKLCFVGHPTLEVYEHEGFSWLVDNTEVIGRCVLRTYNSWRIVETTQNVVSFSESSFIVILWIDSDRCILAANKHYTKISDFYTSISPFCEGLAMVVNQCGKYGYIDQTGTEVIPCMYDCAEDFNEGFAIVRQKRIVCYIDETGNEGARTSMKYGCINKSGTQVAPFRYDYIDVFSDGLAKVMRGGKCGYINKNGVEVIPCKYYYDCVQPFSEGLALIRNLFGKLGYIDKTGVEVIPCQFDGAGPFVEGLAVVRHYGRYGYIDKIGNEVVPCQYDEVENFGEGLARVQQGDKYGYIDKTGNEVLPCQYDRAGLFHEGLARVKQGDKCGCISKTGREVVPCQYDYVENFYYGLARVKQGDKYGYIDKTGKEVVTCQYDEAENFCEGFARVMRSDQFGSIWGCIDKTGAEIVPCKCGGSRLIYPNIGEIYKVKKWGNATITIQY